MADAPPTFSESWYRIAGQKICLRPGVKVRRQYFRGQRWVILENPFSNQFFRLRPAAYEFVARLRPDRTVQEVWQECLDRFPDEAPGQEAVLQLLSQLYYSNLLQYDVATDSSRLFERYKKNRQREVRSKLLNLMFMRFPLLDPDEFLVRTLPWVGKVINVFGAALWAFVVFSGIKIAIDHFPQLRDQSQGVLAPDNLFLLYAGLVFIKTLHEFGHAYFCRKFGGEVHVMGIMLMVFTPIPYMDATSSWAFRSRWKRILVASAGMIVEVFVAAIATFVWANTGQGTVHSLAFNMMFIAGVSTIIFNLNPLLRYDGYYILSDLLEIPNLHQRSKQQLQYWVERYAFGLRKAENPAPNTREAWWLTVFGILSGIYRVVVFTGILLFVADRLLIVGILMAVICAISWVVAPLVKLVNYLGSSPKLERNRPRAIGVTLGFVGVLIVLLQLIPFPYHFRAPGVVQSREWAQVVNESPGFVAEILVRSGSRVEPDQPLVRLVNRELELDLAAARSALGETEARLRQAEASQEAAPNIKPLRSRLAAVEKRLARLREDAANLVLRARQGGIWVAPEIDDFIGRWLGRGTAIGLIIDPSGFEFNATIVQEDADRLFTQEDPRAEIRLFGQAKQPVSVESLRVIPAEQRVLPSAALGWAAGGEIPTAPDDPQGRRAAEPFFQVRAEMAETGGVQFFHGRAGKIRFDLPAEPLLPRWIRRLRQMLQTRYQL